ncbi:hypothetical protein KAK06_14775 [Ideonella sp. 4Y11]|uniref:Restriction endonuclease n=1 Tax=Ideonella aquatica TaxID=2824119 RepID=A0A940YLL3_9BURK|nr:hypothetical protein [Ideonella aquatica]MBQ0960216.1 hypothetical protein [Ideonella aquatica]
MKSDDLAQQALTQLGFSVQKLPESAECGKKMPDFLVRRGVASALVEAKLKVDDSEKASMRERALDSGEVYVSEHVLGRDETLSGIVRNGANQLKADAGVDAEFKVLFVLMDCINAYVVSEQLVDTLYGRTSVFEYGKPPQLKHCYFYRNSDFYRRQETDAAIVGLVQPYDVIKILRICLNPFSPRYLKLKTSEFLVPFNKAVLDPIEEEEAGRAYIPDAKVERKEQEFTQAFPLYDPVLHHLAEKYKTAPLVRADFNASEFAIRSR